MSAQSLFVQFRMLVIYEYFICAREHITQKLVQKRTKWFLVDKPNSISRVCVYVVWSRVAGRWNVPRLLVQMERRYTNESVQPAIDCHRIRAHQSAQTRRSICVHEHDRLASCIRCWWQQQQVRVPTSFLVLINEIIMFRMVVNAVIRSDFQSDRCCYFCCAWWWWSWCLACREHLKCSAIAMNSIRILVDILNTQHGIHMSIMDENVRKSL